ncbi:MAG: CoA pyrophosphatase [marine benthic group bacterium]|nr:CoA pyrophosphatase [Gemmatimonadota bacterium]
MTGEWPERFRSALADRPADRIPETECEVRAAVTLILRASKTDLSGADALFVRRAEVPGDPWSGHVALPGGRRDPDDADLLDTARRETFEETGLRLERADHVGRLGEIHPRSKHLPSICVTPFVAWLGSDQEIRLNYELTGHAWIPVSVLSDPRYRSTLVREAPSVREFPAIDYEGDVIWGLTFAIVEDFLAVLSSDSARDR